MSLQLNFFAKYSSFLSSIPKYKLFFALSFSPSLQQKVKHHIGKLAPPFDHEARSSAGMSPDWYSDLHQWRRRAEGKGMSE